MTRYTIHRHIYRHIKYSYLFNKPNNSQITNISFRIASRANQGARTPIPHQVEVEKND